MRFGILGPLEVVDDRVPISIPAAKQRAVLAILLLHVDTATPGWRLIQDLWADPPVSARKIVQTYISKLRQVLPADVLTTQAAGYSLQVEPDDIDARRFERLVSRAGDVADEEAAVLREALGLWRGHALADFSDEPFAQAEIVRLESMRLTAFERRVHIDLENGRHDVVLAELAALVRENPLDERLRGQWMVALYRSGRQSDALRAYADGRRLLVDHLGVEPQRSLRELQQAILRQDRALDLRPPARAAAPDRVGGPARPPGDTFVGREQERAELRALIVDQGVRWVSLTGPAGVGKTRLAVELARSLGHEYADGWAFIDLAKVGDPNDVAAAACSSLGLHPDDVHGSASVLSTFLANREQLVVLDNFEHLLPAATLVAALLARAPRLTVVVTSRRAVGADGNEHVFVVGPLSTPRPEAQNRPPVVTGAIRLFLDRALAVRPALAITETTLAQVAHLCADLDGLPLAIELAAARVDLLSPRAILTRLGGRLDLLVSDAPAGPERHRSLRAALDWSFELLDADARSVFCQLAIFAGGFTIDSAEAVVTAPQGQLVDVVGQLLHAHLVRSAGAPGEEPRFAMLETIRQYGVARLAQRGCEDPARAAHARAFCAFAELAEAELRLPDQRRWLDLVEAELPNLRAAIRWAVSDGDQDLGLFTAARLWRFWQVRGMTREARSHLGALLQAPGGSAGARAAGHLTIGRCAFQQGDLVAVRHHLDASIPFHRQDGDGYSLGFGLMLLGAASGRSGETDRGARLLREALQVAIDSHDGWLEASCRGYLGMVLSAGGDHSGARFALEEGLRGVRQVGDERLVGWFLIGLGRTALASHDPARAERRFQEALTWAKRLGDAWGEARGLQGLAGAATALGDLEQARDLVSLSLAAAQRAHSRPATACALQLMATITNASGRPDLASALLGTASVISAGSPEPWAADIDGFTTVSPSTLREALDDETFHEWWARGRAMTVEEAVDLMTAAT